MANCHKNFLTGANSFHSAISLDSNKKDSLKTSRKNLRNHIKNKFSEKERPQIKFQIQGSFSMGTTINPINGDYDIDDGLYFSPALENRPTAETVHSWVVEAASSYGTVDPAIDKLRCVRVPFKAGYHVDLPIYDLIENGDGTNNPYLAVKNEGWTFSDPRALTVWFKDCVSEKGTQITRLVRYFKAWADFQNRGFNPKMPSGIILTILAAEEFQYDNRDDVSFSLTASAIFDRLNNDETIINPKDSNENLRNRITDNQFENFFNRLDTLVQQAETALELESSKEAAEKHWVRVLGDRFPVYDDDKEKSKKNKKSIASQGLIGVGTSSA